MQKEPLSLFHEQFLLFLQENLQEKKKTEGWDETIDPEVRAYRDLLSRSIRGEEPLKLQEIIDKHKYLFDKRGPVHLEHKILEAFPETEMKRLGFPPLRMVRGLPRLFSRKSPIFSSKIHPAFFHLPTIKKRALVKPLYSLYAGEHLPKDAKVAIFAEKGDCLAEEMARQLRQAFGSIDVRLALGQEDWELRGFDLLLQVSSGDAAIERILTLDDPRPLPLVERFGREAMGLHFLDRGLFLKSFLPASLADFEKAPVLDEMGKERRFFFANLTSHTGVFVYLHALFKSLEWDGKAIDLCLQDGKALLAYIQARLGANQPILEKSYGISTITLDFGSKTSVFEISPSGKRVRIFAHEADLCRSLLLSEDFTAASGIDGFADAVAANKGFFYDPATLSRSFIKDLAALAENRIATHRSTVNILRLFTKVYEQQCKPEEGEWVDELSIQSEEKLPFLEVAEKIGIYLQDPDALAGFKKLNRLIAKEYSCNAFLLHLVQRAVCHRRRPHIARLEEEAVSKFTLNQISLSHLVQHIQDAFLS